jgi:hypothetical protein
VVSKLFDQDRPSQLLFSYIYNNKCIGYGGLVHINWEDKNAEVSFLMDTNNIESLEKEHWVIFLKLIECAIAFALISSAFTSVMVKVLKNSALDLNPSLMSSALRRAVK